MKNLNNRKDNSERRLINSVSNRDSITTIRRVCSARLMAHTDEDPLIVDFTFNTGKGTCEGKRMAHIIEAWQDPIEGFIVLVEEEPDEDGYPLTHELDSLDKENMINFANLLLKNGSVVLIGKDEEEEYE